MQIEGMEVTRAILRQIVQKVYSAKSLAVKDFSRSITVVIKERTPRDTGALQASIKMRVEEDTMHTTKTNISVGDPSISRGEGPFTQGRDGRIVDVKPTSEYVAEVEAKQGFVRGALGWLDAGVGGEKARLSMESGGKSLPFRWERYFTRALKRAFK